MLIRCGLSVMDSPVDRGDALLDDFSLALRSESQKARLLHIGSLLLPLFPKEILSGGFVRSRRFLFLKFIPCHEAALITW